MEFFRTQPNFDFMAWRKHATVFSIVIMLICLGSLAFQGLKLGIDFSGGVLIEVGYAEPAELDSVRDALDTGGFKNVTVQHFGTAKEVLIRFAPRQGVSSADVSTEIMRVLQAASPAKIEMRRVEFVGPQVGEELTNDGVVAMLLALGAILVYVGLRFEYRLALGAVAALMHDVIVTIGFFSITRMEFDLTVLAAILAVIGYSLNDSIVVFDRMRENFRKVRKGTVVEVTNLSLNQTLSRTVMTGVTTLLVLLALFFAAGELLHGFSTALIVGIVFGTYSSVYVASAASLALGLSKEDLIPPVKEGAETDNRP